ncbi:hypothetical protein CQW23_11560 [Capsicum baccatum]|uniref:YDG domain-containing protein n=1 Tax=Capsicum baccatum TaxID=33114 RepID=A0A2G2WQ62_CAPBA|nr:hypothetical protein CQW23_11560 [Capsicum baccatum]
MASINSLPIDGKGVCMLCKKTPSQEKIVTCITCVTPWHMDYLENPPVRLPSVVNFECPDCVGTGLEGVTVLPPTSAGGDLVAKIREIEVDPSMTEEEKARRRQEIVSGKQIRINENEEDEGKEKDVLSVLGESIKCPFCYVLPDRPVTVTVPVCRFHPTIFVDMDQLDNAKIHIGVLKQLEGNRKEKFNRRLVAEYSSMCLDTMERKECKEEEEGGMKSHLECGVVKSIIISWMMRFLVELLYGLDTSNNLLDAWRWQESGNGLFTISSFYKRLLVREEDTFPYDSIWIPRAPRKMSRGHNFCLKCFKKWIGQGKDTCVKCRSQINRQMINQPRINLVLVIAIRLAKESRKNVALRRPQFILREGAAKKAGMANASSGRIFVTIPSDHFGPILAENDPERNQGVLVGESWRHRLNCRQWGVHWPHVAGIARQEKYGAQSVVRSRGYEDDEDHGEWFLYTGRYKFIYESSTFFVSEVGGNDLSGNKRTNKDQSFDQSFTKFNEALRDGLRYDGVYRIEKCWRKLGKQGYKVCRYLFVRCDNEPAPWTSDEHGDKPRPLPEIPELEEALGIFERSHTPS